MSELHPAGSDAGELADGRSWWTKRIVAYLGLHIGVGTGADDLRHELRG